MVLPSIHTAKEEEKVGGRGSILEKEKVKVRGSISWNIRMGYPTWMWDLRIA